MKRYLLVAFMFVCPIAAFGSVETFDDIEFWVGSGENQAALVIDWHEQCLVWGYRWDGTATGEDMLMAVCQADSRLYALGYYSGPGLGSALGGVGYDTDDDGLYGITNGTSTYDQSNMVDGFVPTGTYDFDDWTSTDSDDDWFSGWYNGYWSYWLGSDSANWGYSGTGMTGRTLVDGCWDGWSWADFAGYGFGSAPEDMEAASVPEPVTMVLFGLGSLVLTKRRK